MFSYHREVLRKKMSQGVKCLEKNILLLSDVINDPVKLCNTGGV